MDYLEPWFAVNDGELANELRRELPKRHVLSGLPVTARARRQDQDDILFEILDGSGRFAQVHLTYQAEVDPRWPTTTIFATEADWAVSMAVDHRDFES
jgi:hypothetical protein